MARVWLVDGARPAARSPGAGATLHGRMLLTVNTTYQPATDLGFLLHKNPARAHTFEVFGGIAHVFYPEASETRCTVALLLEIDAIDLVRRRGPGGRAPAAGGVDQYVADGRR